MTVAVPALVAAGAEGYAAVVVDEGHGTSQRGVAAADSKLGNEDAINSASWTANEQRSAASVVR